MGKRRGVCFLSTLIFTLLLGGSGWAAEPVDLRINYSAISGAFAPVWVAQDEGLFARYGLKTELKFVLAATEVQALLAQSLDVVNAGPELVDARLRGADVVYVGGTVSRFVFSFYSKAEIQKVSDLKGKLVGAAAPNSATDLAARALLREAGITPGKEAQILHLKGGPPEIMTSMVQGVIQAGVLSPPTTLKARQFGLKELVNITERNIPFIQTGVGTTGAFLKEHPDLVRRYLQGHLEGMKIARTEAGRTKKVIGKYTKTSNPEDLEETYRTFAPVWEKVPYVPAAAIKTILGFSADPNARTAKVEQFIDNSLLEELERSGFIEKLYRP